LPQLPISIFPCADPAGGGGAKMIFTTRDARSDSKHDRRGFSVRHRRPRIGFGQETPEIREVPGDYLSSGQCR
ncbi:MAG TPA: hypothetical protein VFO40_13750, partial [Chthoniobacterales bacterium]|nr:hypothetical protein [Chthoniobacterales bacterium]